MRRAAAPLEMEPERQSCSIGGVSKLALRASVLTMGWFGQTWFDRILGRNTRADEGEARRAGIREDDDASDAVASSDIEEGATAARDENVARHEPFHPPGG